jgi:hypothetical protein
MVKMKTKQTMRRGLQCAMVCTGIRNATMTSYFVIHRKMEKDYRVTFNPYKLRRPR